MQPSSAGRGDDADLARAAMYEGLPENEKMLFLDVLTRELEEHGDEDEAWSAAWRAVEDPFVSGFDDRGRPARETLDTDEPMYPNLDARRRFDLEWHVRRARDAGLPLAQALKHAEEDVSDPGRREAEPPAASELYRPKGDR